MLLVQASKDISQPGQAYQMGILEKMVDGLKFILRLIWRTLRVYLFGHLDQWYELSNWSQHFVSYLSITWITNPWIQSNNRILTITRITWITRFPFTSCFDQFCLYFPKSGVNGIERKQKWQKSETYISNQTYMRLLWMAAPISYAMALSVWSPKFICLCINFSHYLNQRISDPFCKQTAPNKCPSIWTEGFMIFIKFLLLTLHNSVGFGQIQIQISS